MSHGETSGRRRRHLSNFLELNGFELAYRASEGKTRLCEIWVMHRGPLEVTLTMLSFDSDSRATVRAMINPGNMERPDYHGKTIESEGYPLVTADGTISLNICAAAPT